MSAFGRKLKRNKTKKIVKELKKSMEKVLTAAVESKMESYNKIPDNCIVCEKPFDKKNRKQAFEWMMQVHEEKNIHNLFCPECFINLSEEEESKEEAANE
ncbi:hypothetical protein CL634_10940 [bacterium]|nr:hypothetical protein [bacterium]|tara:strand:+ start:110 stop:409 length:300 start_codon:yes stop_codon:yes gene_type:complete